MDRALVGVVQLALVDLVSVMLNVNKLGIAAQISPVTALRLQERVLALVDAVSLLLLL